MMFRRHQRRTVLRAQPSPPESYHVFLNLSLMASRRAWLTEAQAEAYVCRFVQARLGGRHARISMLKVYRAVEGG